jgi:hypothetical protein
MMTLLPIIVHSMLMKENNILDKVGQFLRAFLRNAGGERRGANLATFFCSNSQQQPV